MTEFIVLSRNALNHIFVYGILCHRNIKKSGRGGLWSAFTAVKARSLKSAERKWTRITIRWAYRIIFVTISYDRSHQSEMWALQLRWQVHASSVDRSFNRFDRMNLITVMPHQDAETACWIAADRNRQNNRDLAFTMRCFNCGYST